MPPGCNPASQRSRARHHQTSAAPPARGSLNCTYGEYDLRAPNFPKHEPGGSSSACRTCTLGREGVEHGHDEGPHNWLESRCIMRASGPRLSSKSGVRFKGDPLKVYNSAAGVATWPCLAVRVPVRALPSVWPTLNMDACADRVVTAT